MGRGWATLATLPLAWLRLGESATFGAVLAALARGLGAYLALWALLAALLSL